MNVKEKKMNIFSRNVSPAVVIGADVQEGIRWTAGKVACVKMDFVNKTEFVSGEIAIVRFLRKLKFEFNLEFFEIFKD